MERVVNSLALAGAQGVLVWLPQNDDPVLALAEVGTLDHLDRTLLYKDVADRTKPPGPGAPRELLVLGAGDRPPMLSHVSEVSEVEDLVELHRPARRVVLH